MDSVVEFLLTLAALSVLVVGMFASFVLLLRAVIELLGGSER